MQAFAKIGIKLPHYTGTMMKYGKKVSRGELKRGDILFPTSGHVVIYLGNGMQVAASSGKGRVVTQKVTGFYTARRLV
jgi:cell wall-associated NlpC family hydrolase